MSQLPESSNPNAKYQTPRWVKVFGIIATLVLLLIILQFIIGGNHSPSRHMPSGSTPSADVTQDHTSSTEHGD